jgi:hypothetical protein
MWGWIYVLGVGWGGGGAENREREDSRGEAPTGVCVRMMATRWEWRNGSLGERGGEAEIVVESALIFSAPGLDLGSFTQVGSLFTRP